MPSKTRAFNREARKKAVLLAFRRNGMTAREVASALGWPVAVTTSVLTSLACERRIVAVGSQVVTYNAKRALTKEVHVYRKPDTVDPMAMPDWLRGGPFVPPPGSDDGVDDGNE